MEVRPFTDHVRFFTKLNNLTDRWYINSLSRYNATKKKNKTIYTIDIKKKKI